MARWKKITLFVLSATALFVWYAVFTIGARGEIEVIFFDVGQGDAALIQTKDGKQILIDGGPGRTILTKLGDAMPYWDREIELVILTHPHADHIDGLVEVLKNYDVKMVLDSRADYHTADYAEWRRLLEEKQIPIITAKSGQRIHLTSSAFFDVLAPLEIMAGKSFNDIHDAMIVMRLTMREKYPLDDELREQHPVLFTGDAERRVEHQLLTSFPYKIDSDILKVGHHGSKTSSSEAFLKAVSPDVAIISAGAKNRYGHPHQSVLDRLEQLGIQIHRTDIEGDITLHF